MTTIDQGATNKTAGLFGTAVPDPDTGNLSASAEGSIQLKGDRDWFALSALADTRYTVTLKPELSGSPLTVRLRDKSGKEITKGVVTNEDGDGYTTWSFVNGTKAAIFYVEVVGQSSSALGAYTVSYLAERDPVGETTKTTGLIEFPDADRTVPQDATDIASSIQWAGDKDWFKLNTLADTRYSITLTGDTLAVGKLALFDKSGKAMTVDVTSLPGDPGSLVVTFVNVGKASSYFVQVSGVNDEDLGDYVLNAQAVADDHADTAKPAITMAVLDPTSSTAVTGEIQWAKDRDWIKLDAKADHQYTVTLTPDAGALASGGTLRLLDKSGKEVSRNVTIEQSDDGQWELVFLNPLKAASYFIEVAGINDGDLGKYTLTIKDPSYDEGETSKTTSILTTDGVESIGSIQRSNDKDWFKLSAEANRYYTVTLDEGLTDPLTDGRMRLLNKSGQEVVTGVTHGTDADGNRTITFINPDKKSDYFVEVTAATSETVSGSYSLNVTQELDHAATTKTVGVLPVEANPDLPANEIQWAGDKDWFKLTAVADTQYTVTLNTGTAEDTLTNGTLRLLDKSGKEVTTDVTVTEVTDGLALTFVNANKSAVYFVEAAGKTNDDTGTYSFDVATKLDSQGQTAKTSTAVLVDTAATGIIDWANDKDWFKLEADPFTLYRLDLTGTDADNFTDFQMLLRDSKGQILERTTFLKEATETDTLMLAYLNVSSKKTAVYIEVSGIDSETTGVEFALLAQKTEDTFNDFGSGFDPQVALLGLPDTFWAVGAPVL